MATREIVELPDKHTGDINEIRDKKIALASEATAQSDLPQQLEYLIKNGQTGEFMNVLDSYINEKIRSALGGLIANLDKGAAGTTKAIACIDTNNDLGIINPANLASVLGVGKVGELVTDEDVDAFQEGIAYCWGTSNSPGGVYAGISYIKNYLSVQICFHPNRFSYRVKWSVSTWSAWRTW